MALDQKLKPGGEKPHRFQGGLRHYHRAVPQEQATWNNWVSGKKGAKKGPGWLKIAGIILALLGLAAIVGGLINEMI